MKTGLIGLGIMGDPMARNLIRAGFPLTVTTRTAGKAEAFAAEITKENPAATVTPVATASEVAAASEVVITMVTDTPDVVAVMRSEHGVFAGAPPGTIIIEIRANSPPKPKRAASAGSTARFPAVRRARLKAR